MKSVETALYQRPYQVVLTPSQAAWGLMLTGGVAELSNAFRATVKVVERGSDSLLQAWVDRQNRVQAAALRHTARLDQA